ncbi:MFS transporter [Cobetia sp. D5]|uniref:MFS transporter n=1 Tax=unclassified Cobetia TaxID=2609414 RepID=UPI00244BEB41|nr:MULTISPECIES: MFS transporter [unclassified Cobetia]MDH2296958.1 MFS transporter [Cobetia sp. 29-18-1]
MPRHLLLMSLAPLLGLALLGIGNAMLTSLVPLRLSAAGVSSEAIGLISSAYYLGLGLGALVNDRLLLRIGHIRAYAGFASLVAVAALAMGLGDHPVVWFLLRMMIGWSLVGVYLVIESWLLSAADPAVRGRLLALYMIVLYGAGVLGQLLLGVTAMLSLEAAFMLVAMLAAASVLPLVLLPRVSPLIEQSEPLSPWRLIRITPTGVFGCLASGLVVAVIYSLLPLALGDGGTLSTAEIGQRMALVILGGMLLQYPIGRWSDSHDRQQVLIILSVAIVGFAALLMGPAREGIAQLTVLFLLGGAAFTLYPVAVSHAADRAPAGALVRMSQGLLLINAVGSTLSPPAVSLPMAEMGAMPGMALSLAVMGGGMLLFFVWRRVMRPAPQPLAPFETHAPQTPLGTELAVGPELVEAAEEHLRDAEADDPLVEVTRELVADMPELITDASLDSLEEIEVKEEQALHDEQALTDEQSLQDAQRQVPPRDDSPLARD